MIQTLQSTEYSVRIRTPLSLFILLLLNSALQFTMPETSLLRPVGKNVCVVSLLLVTLISESAKYQIFARQARILRAPYCNRAGHHRNYEFTVFFSMFRTANLGTRSPDVLAELRYTLIVTGLAALGCVSLPAL